MKQPASRKTLAVARTDESVNFWQAATRSDMLTLEAEAVVTNDTFFAVLKPRQNGQARGD